MTNSGPEASIRKVLADEHGQDIMAIGKDLAKDLGPCSARKVRSE